MTHESLHGREFRQRATFVARICAGRSVLLLGATVPEPLGQGATNAVAVDLEALDRRVADGAAETVLVVLDDLDRDDVDRVRRAVDEHLAGGGAAIVAARDANADVFDKAWPQARRFHQGLVEVTVLREGGPDTEQSLPLPSLGAHARWTLFLLGDGLADAVVVIDPIVTAGASARQSAALQRANDELRAANAQVRASSASVQSAAAAALQAKASLKDAEIARLSALLDETLAAAKQNDELFQDAREQLFARDATLERPEHRFVARVRHRLSRVPGGLRLARKLTGR